MSPEKRLRLTEARHPASGERLSGYEIHLGRTEGPDCARAWLTIEGRPEGAASADGRVRGCYLHGLFAADGFRAAVLRDMGHAATTWDFEAGVEGALDDLAAHLAQHMDIDALLGMAAPVAP